MPLPLPEPIKVFMPSENTHDTEALAACFAADASVRDEGQTLEGLKAPRTYIRAYKPVCKGETHSLERPKICERDSS